MSLAPDGRSRMQRNLSVIAALAAFTLASCTDTVFRDRPPFNAPPDAASGFLGYYDASSKQTTCGNCHAGFQGGWATTAHSAAFAALGTGSPSSCATCHALTGMGNQRAGTVSGHDAVQTPVYHDVQCESCHGPGLQHVEGVGQGTLIRPLARLAMSGTGNCGDCHTGGHHSLADEWRQSRHANLNTQRATNTTCAQCHEGRAALLRRFGEDANFAEKGDANALIPPATCGVCHDPHGSGNTRQLRAPISSPDPEENLCVRCHLRIGFPEPTGTPTTVGISETSPHAPQGAMLLGFAGWRPPNFQYEADKIFGSHATDRNPRLCAGCHVAQFTVPDELRGGTIQATSHLMRPIPCLDAQGRPTADKNCAYNLASRSWQTCSSGNCHGSAQAAVNAFNDSRALMKSFTDQLWIDSNGNATLNPAPTDAGLLPTVRQTRPGEWANNGVITPAEGAEFNARLCGEYGQATSDNSKGVHNPFLCRALLISTIAFIREYYNLPAASPAEQAVIDRVASTLPAPVRNSKIFPRQ